MKKILTIIILINFSVLYGQKKIYNDTITFKGLLRGDYLLETIELYSDSTFKWTNEYDLRYSEFGKYRIRNKKLILDHYLFLNHPKTMSLKDTLDIISKKTNTRIFEIGNHRIYPLNENGDKILKKKDPYYKRKWSWLFGNKYEYKIISDKNLLPNKID